MADGPWECCRDETDERNARPKCEIITIPGEPNSSQKRHGLRADMRTGRALHRRYALEHTPLSFSTIATRKTTVSRNVHNDAM